MRRELKESHLTLGKGLRKYSVGLSQYEALDRRRDQSIILIIMQTSEIVQRGAKRSAKHESSIGSFALTADDIDILNLIVDHRFLRRDQASTLTGRHAKRL